MYMKPILISRNVILVIEITAGRSIFLFLKDSQPGSKMKMPQDLIQLFAKYKD